MPTRVIKVTDEAQVIPAAEQGARALRKGQLVAFATETVYGIAALATAASTIQRLRKLKKRPTQPFSVHLGRPADARRYVKKLPDSAKRLIAKAWPGPVTILAPTGGRLADAKLQRRKGLYEDLCSADRVGLRCPDEPVALAMLSKLSLPVVAPSANLAGHRSPRTGDDVLACLDGRIDLLIDSGPTRHGTDSTIVSCDEDGWTVAREGVFSEAAVRRMLTRTLLFVCTGNTCRSAMAGGLAGHILAERLGCEEKLLPDRGVTVLSAGVYAMDGGRATPAAVAAAAELGADNSRHRSRMLTRELIQQADLVLCMTDSHVAAAVSLAPEHAENVRRLDPGGDVPDPVGGGPAVYRKTARKIDKALRAALAKGLP